MIYIDTSVLLAQLWAEDTKPPASLWEQTLISSRLTEYETWTRIHARDLSSLYGEAARLLLGRLNFVELAGPALARALEPFPVPVRTLDAVHLASLEFLRSRRQSIQLATYDQRMGDAARAMGIEVIAI